jgi:hypothetical protein
MRDGVERGALGIGALEFLEAVVLQTAHPLGAHGRRGDAHHEEAVVDRVLGLAEASLGDDASVARAAGALAADPRLLAIFFQNLDLLPTVGSRPADAISLLVLMASSLLDEIDEESWRPPGM